jgi:hypothetical protein
MLLGKEHLRIKLPLLNTSVVLAIVELFVPGPVGAIY